MTLFEHLDLAMLEANTNPRAFPLIEPTNSLSAKGNLELGFCQLYLKSLD